MKKTLLASLAIILCSFASLNTALAQNGQEKEERKPRLGRFITVGLIPADFHNNTSDVYGVELGYEHFIGRNTSLLGGIGYGIGKSNRVDLQGNKVSGYDYRELTVFAGIRQRLLNKGKFSLISDLKLGLQRTATDYEGNTFINNYAFLELSIGAEYRFSPRLKGTATFSPQYDSRRGFSSSSNLGLQIRLGKK